MPLLSPAPSAEVIASVAEILAEPLFIPSEPNVAIGATVWLERRDEEHHFTLRMMHPTHDYITVAVCLVLKPKGSVALRYGFSSDSMNYVVPDELQYQEELLASMVHLLQSDLLAQFGGVNHAKAIEAKGALSKERALSKLQQNEDAGMGVARISNVQPYGSKEKKFSFPGIAAPTTRLGASKIIGVYDHGQTLPKTIYHDKDDKSLTVRYFEHETLKALEGYTSAEKMEILQGTHPKFEYFYPTFQQTARRGAICLPVARADLALSQLWYHQSVLNLEATYKNGDSGTFDLSCGASHHMYCQFRVEVPRVSSNIWISINDKEKVFVVERGRTNETRFSSPDLLDECARTALGCLLDIDPVWPDWITPLFTEEFEPKHPLLAGHDIPARHQGFVALLLGKAYDKAHKGAKKLEALKAKKAAAVKAKAADTEAYPDGTIFAFLKKGARADQADLKQSDIRRLSILVTDHEAKSKSRRRVLEPLNMGYTAKPFTSKNRVNFVPLKNADAVRLLSDFELGWESREQFEMAYRLSVTLSGDAFNPLLTPNGTIEIVHWAGDDVHIRVTRLQTPEGQDFLALRILRERASGPAYDSSAGIAFVTGAKKAWTVALPSTFDVEDRLPQSERDILLNFISATQGTNAEGLKRRLRVAFADDYLNPV